MIFERRARTQKRHIEKGLCRLCSKNISKNSKSLCEYHQGYNAGYNKARYNKVISEEERRAKG